MTRLEQHVAEGRTRHPMRDPRGTALGYASHRAVSVTERGCGRQDVRRAIETVVVPRMGRLRGTAADVVARLDEADVHSLVELLLRSGSQSGIVAHIEALERSGVPLEAIYLELFQPAARRIGELWGDDRCSFMDVTLAVGRLQTLLRMFELRFHQRGLAPAERRKALLLSPPGDQHTFGLAMVTQFFRRAGWGVWSAPIPSLEALRAVLTQTTFAVVGFSASGESRLDALAAAIRTIRRHARAGRIGIMVGGPLFVDHPHYAAQVGADAVGRNAMDALAKAEVVVAAAAGS